MSLDAVTLVDEFGLKDDMRSVTIKAFGRLGQNILIACDETREASVSQILIQNPSSREIRRLDETVDVFLISSMFSVDA